MLTRLMAVLVTVVPLIACATAASSSEDDPVATDSDLTATKHTLFLNFEGGDIVPTNVDFGLDESSELNVSVLAKRTASIAPCPFAQFASTPRAKFISMIAARVRTIMKPYDISVVTTRPPRGKEYTMIMVSAGDDTQLGSAPVAGLTKLYGTSPFDCKNSYEPNIGFIFPDDMELDPNDAQKSANFIAAIASHESGHLFGLKDSSNQADVMYPYGGTQDSFGGNALIQDVAHDGKVFTICGTDHSQDSNALMLAALGPRH